MDVRQALARLAATVFATVFSLALCVAGIAVAFVTSAALFGLTPSQLRQPATLSWLLVFLLLVFTFATAFVVTGYGLLVFVLHRLSATRLLSLLGTEPSGSGVLSRLFARAQLVGQRLGSRGAP